jgi:hypothetical protein
MECTMDPGILKLFLVFCFITTVFVCCDSAKLTEAPHWKEVEITFISDKLYDNAYTDVEFWVEFTHDSGEKIIRPGFWYESNTWKVRFASTQKNGEWKWKSYALPSDDSGLNGIEGRMRASPYTGSNPLIAKGLLRISPGKRNVIHANGATYLMVGDTPWALPWRGTVESVTRYAENRQERGFNAALLMTLQPDRGAVGPRSRIESGGFDVAFEDLPQGHINKMNHEYFKYFDKLRDILIEHGIVPVYQPVFHGFGWKGLDVLGWNMDPDQYARYCRYLVARYGAAPAMWLISGDSDGRNAGVLEGGEEVHKWDAYRQPAGFHYSPYCEVVPDWWDRDYDYDPHFNRVHQDKEWLGFQWCQSGHNADHQPWKVEKMYNNLPVKAVANGEPTYEGISNPHNASGWWQGHEAWLNFTSGGTMGVVYGAGGLWNWKLYSEEQGWPTWADSKVSWKEAIELPGAVYVGYLGKALKGLGIADIEKKADLAQGELCLAKPGELYIIYLPEGGKVKVSELSENMLFEWFDPKAGKFISDGRTPSQEQQFDSSTYGPMVLIIKKQEF